ncbi:MAG TPA: hypothetical protein VFY10_08060 [Dehalococcoidia bacterium]|nr:hypothetical protein [Dehalococcoidia bacterium]
MDMILSLMLPIVAMVLVGMLTALIIRYTALSDKAAYASPRPSRVSEIVPRRRHRHVNGWESPLDAEIQHLKRKSMGL